MASLKEVKARIGSVNSTKKITGAMKMVSSAKLKKAQMAIENILPYQNRLNGILESFLATETDFKSDFSAVREIKKMAIVVFSSNSSLCGAFNSNVIKEMNIEVQNALKNGIEVTLYPIGKKVKEAAQKLTQVEKVDIDQELADHPTFEGSCSITNELMAKFLNKEYDKVLLIYHHLKNTAVQKEVNAQATQTYYTFACGPVDLRLKQKLQQPSKNYMKKQVMILILLQWKYILT